MNRLLFIFTLIALPFIIAPDRDAQAATVNTGLWEVSISTSVTGMKTALPVQTIQQCVTDKNMLPRDVNQQGCKVNDVKVSGGNVSWTMACNNKAGNIHGKGRLSYSGSTMQGESNMTIKQSGQTIQMQQKYNGKRVGKCKK